MNDAFDYSELLQSEDGISGTWREIYEEGMPLAWNIENILRCTVFLPQEFYDLVAAYFMLPSALCRVIPYLFLFGQSGSGKSTIARIAACLHGVDINSSSDTFAGIRNSLNERRKGIAQITNEESPGGYYLKNVERNTCMVWDDIDGSVFSSSPDLYRLFKFGYDRATDKITVSSGEVGQNTEFHTFCPKIFSSISPLHLDERFKELRRRLIVIPCKRIEDLSDERKLELNVTDDNWQSKLIDLNNYNWQGLSYEFLCYWNMVNARRFISERKVVSKIKTGFTSQQRAISLDILATGLVTGIWQDTEQAIARMSAYWQWLKKETEENAGLTGLLKDYVRQEQVNAKNGNRPLQIYTAQLRQQVTTWVERGWLYEKPKPTQIKQTLLDLGLRLQQGIWRKG